MGLRGVLVGLAKETTKTGGLTSLPRQRARDAPFATTMMTLQTTSAIVGPALKFSGQSGRWNSAGRCVSRYAASASADTPRTESPARNPTAVRAVRAPSARRKVRRSGWGPAAWDSRSESGVEGLRDMVALMQAVPREVVELGWACGGFGAFVKDEGWVCIYMVGVPGV